MVRRPPAATSVADRFSRKAVIAISLALWSVMTALCGTAGSFLTRAHRLAALMSPPERSTRNRSGRSLSTSSSSGAT